MAQNWSDFRVLPTLTWGAGKTLWRVEKALKTREGGGSGDRLNEESLKNMMEGVESLKNKVGRRK